MKQFEILPQTGIGADKVGLAKEELHAVFGCRSLTFDISMKTAKTAFVASQPGLPMLRELSYPSVLATGS